MSKKDSSKKKGSSSKKQASSLEPFDPFPELDVFRSLSSQWGSLPSLLRRFEDFPTRTAPSVDISEDDAHYIVTAEIPGAKKEDVTVELEDNVLTIRGEKKREREEKDEHHRYVERIYGSFSRSFSLPANADPDRIDASIKDGVLTLGIGKREETKPKTISVK